MELSLKVARGASIIIKAAKLDGFAATCLGRYVSIE